MLISSKSSERLRDRLRSGQDAYCRGLHLSARWFVLSQTAQDGVNVVVLPNKEAAEYCAADLYHLVEGDRVFFLPESGRSVERSNYKSSLGVQRTAAIGKLMSREAGLLIIVTYPEALSEEIPAAETIRESVLSVLREQGGELVEFPYSNTEEHVLLERSARSQLAIPDMRRGRLRSLLKLKPVVTIIEAHSGLTGLIAENTVVTENERTYQFDGMWVSSLCDSTAKGKPDIELVDMSSRLRTIDDIMEVTTKPIILDGDTGGIVEHFVHNIRTLERMGVSAVIIEDKIGLKKNSLFGTEVEQTQDTIEHFCEKIQAGKRALKTRDFMLIARIESLILEKGMDDALARAFAYVKAGADGIMIHSRKQSPDEIFTFCERFRAQDALTPLVVVPTSFNQVTEDEFAQRQINIVIYANQLTRSAVPAMMKTAETILRHHRALEADQTLMPFKDIIRLIPEE